jgi:hypothetical protein
MVVHGIMMIMVIRIDNLGGFKMQFSIERNGQLRYLPNTGWLMYAHLRDRLDAQAGGSLWSEFDYTVQREELIKFRAAGQVIRFRLKKGDGFKHWR